MTASPAHSQHVENAQHLLDSSTGFVVLLEPEGRILGANEPAARVAGTSPRDLAGRLLQDLPGIAYDPSVRKQARVALRRARVGEIVQGDVPFLCADGVRTMEFTVVPLRDDEGGVSALLAQGRHAGELDRAREELARREQQLTAFVQHAPSLIVMLDASLRIVEASDRFLDYFGIARDAIGSGTIYEILPFTRAFHGDHERVLRGATVEDEVVVRSDPGAASRVHKRTLKPWREPDGRAGGVLVVIEDVTHERHLVQELKESERRMRLALNTARLTILQTDLHHDPVRTVTADTGPHDAPTGASAPLATPAAEERLNEIRKRVLTDLERTRESITIGHEGQERHYDVVGEPLLDDDGRPAGVTLACHDVTERREAERSLERRERFYRALLENNSEGIALVDERKVIRYLSPGAVEMLGHDPRELEGRQRSDLVHPEDEIRLDGIRRALGPGETGHLTYRYRHAGGDYIWLSAYITNLTHDPAVGAFVMNYRDITQLLDLLEKARSQEARLRTALGFTPLLLAQTDRDGRYSWIANFPAQYTPDLVLGRTLEEVLPSEETRAVTRLVREVASTGRGERCVVDIDIEGRTRTFDIHVEPDVAPDGSVRGTISAALDVTEQRAATEALEASERRFEKLIQYSNDITAVLDDDKRLSYISNAVTNVIGYRVDELAGVRLRDVIDPAQRDAVDAFTERVLREGRALLPAYRVRHKNGSPRWLETVGTDLRDDPDVRGIVLNTRDITERLSDLREIEATRDGTFRALGLALEFRDYETRGHTDRVVALGMRFGKALRLGEDEMQALLWGAYLHDIGKIAIPDGILLKPGRLTREEFEHVKRHTLFGSGMCSGIPFLPEGTRLLIRNHHERWDGSGYPDAVAGEEIPRLARVFSLVDVYDALTSERPYKAAWTHEEAVAEIRSQSGRQFDPDLTRVFLNQVVPPAPTTPPAGPSGDDTEALEGEHGHV